MQNLAVLLGRIGLALIFIVSGIGKLRGYDATAAYMVAHGLPGGLLPLVIFAELGGGLAILFGFLTRWAALGLFVHPAGRGIFPQRFQQSGTVDQFHEEHRDRRRLSGAGGVRARRNRAGCAAESATAQRQFEVLNAINARARLQDAHARAPIPPASAHARR